MIATITERALFFSHPGDYSETSLKDARIIFFFLGSSGKPMKLHFERSALTVRFKKVQNSSCIWIRFYDSQFILPLSFGISRKSTKANFGCLWLIVASWPVWYWTACSLAQPHIRETVMWLVPSPFSCCGSLRGRQLVQILIFRRWKNWRKYRKQFWFLAA